MSKQRELLEQYKNDVENLRKCAKKLDLDDENVDRIFEKCFKVLRSEEAYLKTHQYFCNVFLKFSTFCAIFGVFLYVLLNVHLPTSSLVLRNVQGLIYPGLKVLRSLSVPVIKQFPFLTDLYDESCLVENPFFYVSEMECWPCETVHSVIDLTGFDNHSLYQSGIPYIVKTIQPKVDLEDLRIHFKANEEIYNRDANNFQTTDSSIKSLDQFFSNKSKFKKSSRVVWRINKMLPGRQIRKLFPRPYIISDRAGQSIERFVIIDGPSSEGYTFPNTECSYVFAIQTSGERIIILKPSKECGDSCRTVSVILKPSYVLWYNWWYWRPISLPGENATTSITYISSYC